MSYYCDICVKTIKLKSKKKLLKSISHNELEKSLHIIHHINNPRFFDNDDIYNNFIEFHKKNIILIIKNVILILVFNLICILTKRFVIGKSF